MLFNSVVPETGLQGQERTSGGWFSLLDQENEKAPCCTSAGQDPALPGLLAAWGHGVLPAAELRLAALGCVQSPTIKQSHAKPSNSFQSFSG